MLSIELKVAVAASVSVVGSVLLVCMCLYYRRYWRNRRCPSNSVENGKSDKPHDSPGITNIACDDAKEESDIYETCKDIDLEGNATASEIYEHVTIRKPNYQECNNVQEMGVDLEDQAIDCPDDRVYAVLEGPSEQPVTSEPIYFTLENNSNQPTETDQINEHEEHSGRTGDEGTHGDTCSVNIQDEIYENVQEVLEGHVVNPGSHGISEDTYGNLDDHSDGETRTVSRGGGVYNEGYTDERAPGDIDEQGDRNEVTYGDEDSPDEGIYDNWENEIVSRKKQDYLEVNEDRDGTKEGELQINGDMDDRTANVDADSGFESIYENIKDCRSSLAAETSSNSLHIDYQES